uniref:Uncharacterized protein n=1 Tax=Cacopsylla melanoneura TaxID=428564 RepID=A0A8D8R126_9HEMI
MILFWSQTSLCLLEFLNPLSTILCLLVCSPKLRVLNSFSSFVGSGVFVFLPAVVSLQSVHFQVALLSPIVRKTTPPPWCIYQSGNHFCIYCMSHSPYHPPMTTLLCIFHIIYSL